MGTYVSRKRLAYQSNRCKHLMLCSDHQGEHALPPGADMARHPSYGEAILWLIRRERLDWIDNEVPEFPFTVVMLAELFDVSEHQILRDVKATLDSAGKP